MHRAPHGFVGARRWWGTTPLLILSAAQIERFWFTSFELKDPSPVRAIRRTNLYIDNLWGHPDFIIERSKPRDRGAGNRKEGSSKSIGVAAVEIRMHPLPLSKKASRLPSIALS